MIEPMQFADRLSRDQARELEALLAGSGHEHPLARLYGIAAALVAGPTPVPPNRWLPHVWGEPGFADLGQARLTIERVMVAYNEVAASLTGEREPPTGFDPAEGEAALPAARAWCRGFVEGMRLSGDWRSHLGGDALGRYLWPVSVLSAEDDAKLPENARDPALQARALPLLPELALAAYRYWQTQRTGGAGKVGRNDPCPCGSGKKYKKCCGVKGGRAPRITPPASPPTPPVP